MSRTALGFLLGAGAALLAPAALGQTVTQLIDASGDGAGHGLDSPFYCAVDAAGTVYVTGSNSDNAFRIDPDGTITQIIDASGDGTHPLESASGIGVDGAGNVFVSGYLSRNVFKVTPGGVITQVIDVTGDGAGHELLAPREIAVDADDNVYVSEVSDHNVFRIAPDGQVTVIIDRDGDGVHLMFWPTKTQFDDAGNAYVLGLISRNVFRIAPSGEITELFNFSIGPPVTGCCPQELVRAPSGDLYLPVSGGDAVYRIAPDGSHEIVLDDQGDGAGHGMDTPVGIARDADGGLYVTAIGSDNVFWITPDGLVSQVLDSTGDGSGHAMVEPQSVVTDALGNVYVVASTSDNVFRIDAPECFLVIGGGTDTAPFAPAGHVFTTQVGQPLAFQGVLMESTLEIPLPTAGGPWGLQATGATPGGATASGGGGVVPTWMLDGRFTVQVVMWNPSVFPGQPEQTSHGLAVSLLPDGTVLSRPYGRGTGMTLAVEIGLDADGQPVLRFPFEIPGL